MELVRTKQLHKAIGARVEELSTILKVAMGDAEALTSDGRVLATWRGQVSSRIDIKHLAKERPDIAAAYRREQLSRCSGEGQVTMKHDARFSATRMMDTAPP